MSAVPRGKVLGGSKSPQVAGAQVLHAGSTKDRAPGSERITSVAVLRWFAIFLSLITEKAQARCV